MSWALGKKWLSGALLLSCAACGQVGHDDSSAAAPPTVEQSRACPGWPALGVARVDWWTDALSFDDSFVWIRTSDPQRKEASQWSFRVQKAGGLLEPTPPLSSPPRAVYSSASRVTDASYAYSVTETGTGPGIARAALDGSVSELLLPLPDKGGVLASDDEAKLLLDGTRLYVSGATGRLFRIDTRTRELTLMAACAPWDDDDFGGLLGMDETSVYFVAGSNEGEDVFALLRTPK